jgi:multiple sugar transport system substrate-binding protein
MSLWRFGRMWARRAGVLCALFVTLAGCGQRDVTVLKFWAMGREAEVVHELMPEFEKAHPGVRVEIQALPFTSAHEKLLTAFAGDSTPDVCQLGNSWIPEFTALDALTPLDERIAASKVVDRSDYFDGIWATNVIEGQVRGVPWYVDTRLFFYRRDILAKAGYTSPPKTWAEWHEMLLAIKRVVGPKNYSVLVPLNEFEPLQILALQQPDAMLRDDGRYGNFRSESFRKALAFYVSMFDEKLAPPYTNTQISNVWMEFGRGYFSFYITGPWNVGEFKRRLRPDQQDLWMTASMPGPDGPGVSNPGGSSLVIFKRSKHQQLAWELIEFLSQPAQQARFHALTGDLPPRRSTWKAPQFAGDVYSKAFREQLERLRPFPQVPEWERIMEEMKFMQERVSRHKETLDQGVTRLDAHVDRLLEKRRWMLAQRDERAKVTQAVPPVPQKAAPTASQAGLFAARGGGS